MKVPDTREITLETAKELEFSITGLPLPVNDGRDVPGWDYLIMRTVCGKTFRVPTRYTGN